METEDADCESAGRVVRIGELHVVNRPARDGDHLSIDLTGTRHGEPIEGLTATDFLYELGSGSVIAELDQDNPRSRLMQPEQHGEGSP